MGDKTEVLIDGLYFAEGPRWHEDRLWLSDMQGRRVLKVDMEGNVEDVAVVPGQPSGLGWLPDGHLLMCRWWTAGCCGWTRRDWWSTQT